MKKFILALSLTMAMAAGTTAMAAAVATPDKANASVALSGPESNYTTVIIEDSSDNIVYLNQYDNAISDTATFLMNGAENGTYTLSYGGVDAVKSVTFTVAEPQPEEELVAIPAIALSQEEGKETYSKGFVNTITIGDNESVVVKVGEKEARFSIASVFGELAGEGSIKVAVKITGIPAEFKDAVSVYFSNIAAQ